MWSNSIRIPSLKFVAFPFWRCGWSLVTTLIGLVTFTLWPLTSKWVHGSPVSWTSFLPILSLFHLPQWDQGLFHPWRHRPRSGPKRHAQDTEGLSQWLAVLNTLMCGRALDSFSCQGMYCISVWRPSAGVPIGSVSLQALRCWGVRGGGERYWLSDLRPRLCSSLRKSDVLRSVACARFPLQRPPPAP